MSYVVHGATGAQGGPLVSALVAAGESVVALTRDPAAAVPGASTVVADLASEASLADAYGGAEGVFVHLPLGPEEVVLPYARNIAAATARARPARVVVSTSGKVVDAPGHPLQQPEGSALAVLLDELGRAGVSHAVAAPRLFLENLLLPPVLEGVRADGVLRYPIREDFAASWVSHRDVAEAASALLRRPDVRGVVGVGDPAGITGPELAVAFAQHLGREVRFEPIVPARFGELIVPLFGDAATAGVVALYEALWQQPDHRIAADTSARSQLGLRPHAPVDWLAAAGT